MVFGSQYKISLFTHLFEAFLGVRNAKTISNEKVQRGHQCLMNNSVITSAVCILDCQGCLSALFTLASSATFIHDPTERWHVYIYFLRVLQCSALQHLLGIIIQ